MSLTQRRKERKENQIRDLIGSSFFLRSLRLCVRLEVFTMSAPFRVSRRVDFCDTDMAGIIHFSNFFRYMEFAEVAFLRSRGLSVAMTWGEEHLGFPRVSATCDFLHPVRFDDVVEIAVNVERVGSKSVTYSFDFTHEGNPVARGGSAPSAAAWGREDTESSRSRYPKTFAHACWPCKRVDLIRPSETSFALLFGIG